METFNLFRGETSGVENPPGYDAPCSGVIEYPDSDKIGVWGRHDDALDHLVRRSPELDYWDGERVCSRVAWCVYQRPSVTTSTLPSTTLIAV